MTLAEKPSDAEYIEIPELAKRWKLTEDQVKRLLNPRLPVRVCPNYIDPEYVLPVGGKRVLFSYIAKWPPLLKKTKGDA
jgi:hypothetical protein